MKIYKYFFIIIIILLISCSYKFRFLINPEDSEILINNNRLSNSNIFFSKKRIINVKINRKGYLEYQGLYKKVIPFGIKSINIDLIPEKYLIEIKTIDETSDILFESKNIGVTPCKFNFDFGIYNLTLSSKNYPEQQIRVESKRGCVLLFRLQKNTIFIKQVGIFNCGYLPKQVLFSPDSKFIYIPLLSDYGFEIFDIDNLNIIKKVIIPDDKKNQGFAEGLFIKEKGTFLVSQMSTGNIYEYSYPKNEYLRTINSNGILSKFIAWSPVLQVIAISNWLSNDVSIIEYSTGNVIRKIKTALAPRGLAFSPDGKYLYVASFEGGRIQKFNTSSWIEKNYIFKKNGAMRHIVQTMDGSKIYVSNMYHNEIYEISTDDFIIKNIFKVFDNPNTISLTPDEKYLYVSCRGKNDKESYLNRSPSNGRIVVINLYEKKIDFFLEGGNQPTGLDISTDGNYLCFSNFRDNNIELYWIGK